MSEDKEDREDNLSTNWGFVVVFGMLVAGVVLTVAIIADAIVSTSCR